jgi:hypothetical protein
VEPKYIPVPDLLYREQQVFILAVNPANAPEPPSNQTPAPAPTVGRMVQTYKSLNRKK